MEWTEIFTYWDGKVSNDLAPQECRIAEPDLSWVCTQESRELASSSFALIDSYSGFGTEMRGAIDNLVCRNIRAASPIDKSNMKGREAMRGQYASIASLLALSAVVTMSPLNAQANPGDPEEIAHMQARQTVEELVTHMKSGLLGMVGTCRRSGMK